MNNVSEFMSQYDTQTTKTTSIAPNITTVPHTISSEPAIISTTPETENDEHFCRLILYTEIGDSRVRVWDLLILLPTTLFFIGLLVKLNSARLKLRAVHSPIYATFYGLIWLNTLISVTRCIVSMTVNAASPSGDLAGKILYVIVRFFLLATEMSVVVFAIFFGHLDNKTSIRRVLFVTSLIAFPYSVVQGVLEVVAPDEDFHIPSKDYDLFAHGGSLFWFISSLIFTMIYSFILILRMDCLRKRFLFLLWMPMKRAFYIYLAFLVMLNLIQSIGSGLYHVHADVGLCLVNITSWTYFSLLTPLIYYTFISEFFGQKNREQVENIVFSYKSEDEEDTSSLPLPSAEYPPSQNIYQEGTERGGHQINEAALL
ncbi:transmembrane protein adipocyte-associated 1 homolog isoform X2 [Oratosquilla oratoria]|uniref:transmembrane protein adipocyte-associated 1 homolog isoform X2 n=1 Tax=Oratosquilla oratoria TaxID=337810 RepID=UPI003F7746A2